jgi:hypothetical protein
MPKGNRAEGGGRQKRCEPDGQLTTLALDIVSAILDETLPADLKLFDLAVDPPALWEERSRIDGMIPRSCIESCR